MFRLVTARRLLLAALIALIPVITSPVGVSAALSTNTGAFPDGATFLIEKPTPWNGTLLLYSHGYVTPGSPNPARDVGDPLTRQYLLDNGYALAGSSYAHTGWALQEAFVDQVATLDTFTGLYGHPTRTIAWGHSLGGIITAGLLQNFPSRFTAALPMCGVLAGGIGVWNVGLDAEFAIKQLLAPASPLQLVRIANPTANLALAKSILNSAQATPQGKARIALAAALSDLPGWFSSTSTEPSPTDFATQETNQFLWTFFVDGPFSFALRAELEFRAGGNPSWNTGVNYAKQLDMSVDKAEVQALYQQAGLNLEADLATLDSSPRIAADPGAVAYLQKFISFNGDLGGKPVLTLHTIGDGLVLNEDEQAYRSVVQDAKDSQLLRQSFVHRAGHCTFTPAETLAGLKALEARITTRKWAGVTDPSRLNAVAIGLGASLNTAPASFVDFEPAPFLRPSDAGTH